MALLLWIGAAHAASSAQSGSPRLTYAPVMKTERLGAGVIRIVYDLNGAAGARFTVTLEASSDGGQTFAVQLRATTGDVGPNVASGTGKAIEWDSAKDIDDLQFDRFVFRVTLTPAYTSATGSAVAAMALKIVVLEGEAAVNVVRQKTAVAPLVEVRDRNDQPVAGALVTFAVRNGKATFSGARTVTVTTNAAGRAAVTTLDPISRGVVQINVQAAFQGQTAAASITQTNVMTAAQAASASAAAGGGSGGGGGLSSTAVAGIAGGGAAGVAVGVAALKSGGGASPVPPLSVTTSPSGTGIREITVFSFTTAGGSEPLSNPSWDFGDGSRGSGGSVTHVYATEGVFQVTLSKAGSSETATTVVRVGSLSGTWLAILSLVDHRLVVTQQGNQLNGQWIVEVHPGATGVTPELTTVRGTISDPRNVVLLEGGICQRTVTTVANGDLTSLSGPVVPANPACTGVFGNYQFNRQ